MLPKRYRLKRKDFANVYTAASQREVLTSQVATRSNTSQYSGKFLKLRLVRLPSQKNLRLASSLELATKTSLKVGVVISKKTAKRAVLRNRLRRQIRGILAPLVSRIDAEIASKNSLGANLSYNLIVTIVPFAIQPNFLELQADLHGLLQKSKLIKAI
jgi:ribonuclease P protein component